MSFVLSMTVSKLPDFPESAAPDRVATLLNSNGFIGIKLGNPVVHTLWQTEENANAFIASESANPIVAAVLTDWNIVPLSESGLSEIDFADLTGIL